MLLIGNEKSPIHYGGDYLAYWTAGKIADDKGYSLVYNLNEIRAVQTTTLTKIGYVQNKNHTSFTPFPAPYLSFFIIPFQFLSKIELPISFWIWVLFNFFLLIGYLIFFSQDISKPKDKSQKSIYYVLFPILSFPVFNNLANGQVNILLLIFIGEFIRNSIKGKELQAGFWIGGLLLKPQLIILLIPYLLISRKWKVLLGFFFSAATILFFSLLLSGIDGVIGLFNLWTKWGDSNAITAPGSMINWRMIGEYLNRITGERIIGEIVSALGIIITLILLLKFLKNKTAYGSSTWVFSMTGLFSATLLVSWHSHHHMAIILIPLLVGSVFYRFFSGKIIIFWSVIIPIVWILTNILDNTLKYFSLLTNFDFVDFGLSFSGLVLNIMILLIIQKSFKDFQGEPGRLDDISNNLPS